MDKKIVLYVCCALALISCGKTDKPASESDARLYVTTSDFSSDFKESGLNFSGQVSEGAAIVEFDDSQTFQIIDGFGAAMTWASCANLLKMSPEDRHTILEELFDKEKGLGISLVRVTIGASDFNESNYTWCDLEGIGNFAVNMNDREVVFPILSEMLSINPDVKIIASPWSCPRWMKCKSETDSTPYNSWTGGVLAKKYLQDYASYFVKWIQAMEKNGFPIYAVTLQNEPLNPNNSISLTMSWQRQLEFIKTAVGPAFEKAGIKAKILVYDHNFDCEGKSAAIDYPIHIYDDPEASKYVAGSAWHNYSGVPSDIDRVIQMYPDKEIYFTEASIGKDSLPRKGEKMLLDFWTIFLQMLDRGCKGVTLWNMVLNSDHGPYFNGPGSYKTGLGVVTMAKSSRKITVRNSHYYNIAHCSKVIRPGAVKVKCLSASALGTDMQAALQVFRNPDGTHAIVGMNPSDTDVLVAVKDVDGYLEFKAPAMSICSLIW